MLLSENTCKIVRIENSRPLAMQYRAELMAQLYREESGQATLFLEGIRAQGSARRDGRMTGSCTATSLSHLPCRCYGCERPVRGRRCEDVTFRKNLVVTVMSIKVRWRLQKSDKKAWGGLDRGRNESHGSLQRMVFTIRDMAGWEFAGRVGEMNGQYLTRGGDEYR